jgi:CubicO group peptidase (beta-lactamase class C family)
MKVSLLVLVLIPQLIRAEPPPAPLADENNEQLRHRVDELAQSAMRESPIVGLSIGVSYRGANVLIQGYGFADVEHHLPATAETVYHFDSITKNMTAAALMTLVEDGAVALDDKVGDYLPAFSGSGASIRQLLNHTSGITDIIDKPDFEHIDSNPALGNADVYEVLKRYPLDYQPGQYSRYRQSGYALAELIVAREGLGYLIGFLGANGSYDAMYAVVLTVAFLGFAADRGYQMLMNRMLQWREQTP